MQDRSDTMPEDRPGSEDPVLESDRTAPHDHDFDAYASYEDGDGVVICDRKDAKAWLKSDTIAELTL